MKALDLTNKQYGQLTAIERIGTSHGAAQWLCQCSCGNQTTVAATRLKSGHTQSCGCLASKQLSKRNETHGMSHYSEYPTWKSMRARCNNPNTFGYQFYGDRGIKVCKRWDDFSNFYADMGPRPEGMTLDRIDPDGNYEPSNCRWATTEEQGNNRRNTTAITYNGITLSARDWSKRVGVSERTILRRYHAGLSVEQVLYPYTEKAG